MKIKPLRKYHDYKTMKDYVESNSKKNSDVEVMSVLIEEYERKLDFDKKNIEIEPIIDNVFNLVKKASHYEKPGLVERVLKLGEEYGELSAEILKLSGYKRNSLTKDTIKYNILLESTDCLIMVFDIMIEMGFSKEEISNMANKQVSKWLETIEVRL